MIFVTVGTTDFDALVQVMDQLSPSLSEKIVIQTGRSKYVPEYCEHFRFAPSLDPYYEDASLVVSHGGLGIVTEVMERGCPLITVDDSEQPDQHQREILSEWERAGHLIWCQDSHELPQVIAQAGSHQFKPYAPPECKIHVIIAEFLDKL